MNKYCIEYTKKYYNKETKELEDKIYRVSPDPKWIKENSFKKLAERLNIKHYKIINTRRT